MPRGRRKKSAPKMSPKAVSKAVNKDLLAQAKADTERREAEAKARAAAEGTVQTKTLKTVKESDANDHTTTVPGHQEGKAPKNVPAPGASAM